MRCRGRVSATCMLGDRRMQRFAAGVAVLLALVVLTLVARAGGGVRTILRSTVRRAADRIRASFPTLLKTLALVLAAVLIGLAISEVAVRRTRSDESVMTSVLLFQQSNREVHRVADDWFLHYDLRPGAHLDNIGYWGNRYHMNIDEFGARAPAHSGAKGAGVFRILCFGGSTMYGADVSDEETIPASMERRLNDESAAPGAPPSPRRFEAWNFGTHAYVLSQAAHRARTELAARDPDLILVQLHNVGARDFFWKRVRIGRTR